jgi:hypothetical protein
MIILWILPAFKVRPLLLRQTMLVILPNSPLILLLFRGYLFGFGGCLGKFARSSPVRIGKGLREQSSTETNGRKRQPCTGNKLTVNPDEYIDR